MSAKIRVLIIDDTVETRENLSKLLLLEEDIEVAGEAGNGEEGVARAARLKPDVVLMDINMPVMDGIRATEKLSCELPQIGVIMLSVQGEQEYLRKAMAAGARDYLTKPPSNDELIQTIRRVYEAGKIRHFNNPPREETKLEPGKIISVFSTKGGVGKSTLAANLAVSLAKVAQARVALVDLDLQFGDIAMMFDLLPRRTMSDLVAEMDPLDQKLLESYLMDHPSGVKVLPAPLRPEYAEVVQAKHIETILTRLQECYNYIIIDTCPNFDDINLTALDHSDLILMVTTLDVLTIKNVKLGLEAMAALNYESDKIKLVLNRSTAEMGVTPADLVSSLRFPISCSIPSDGKVVVAASNRGEPFVSGEPKAPVSEAINHLAREIAGLPSLKPEKAKSLGWRSFKGR